MKRDIDTRWIFTTCGLMNRSRRPPSLPCWPPGELLFTAQQTGSKLQATGASTGGVAMIWQWFGWVGVVGGAGDSRGGAAVTRNSSAATIGTCHPEPPTSEEYRAPGRSLTPHAPPHQPAQLLSDNLYEISQHCRGLPPHQPPQAENLLPPKLLPWLPDCNYSYGGDIISAVRVEA
ncbi:hypothetical protein Pcinc_031997 [Petrolisthes cinctipes]|uniref:Uncharacterized protein n=1 Tax=Petrolisthes cinctipes TaxID=88211 RepID=A0AAE1EVG0_PETCI|nr:hypothetical protein Pcinc_033854 [Petrolisthes cinctipes]KAK3862106.1 hypothetical protein Pcinc_031997 [Petrolisthes cinctipes]